MLHNPALRKATNKDPYADEYDSYDDGARPCHLLCLGILPLMIARAVLGCVRACLRSHLANGLYEQKRNLKTISAIP